MSGPPRHPLLVEADAWAAANVALLSTCFEWFEDHGEWPTLEELQHEFELAGLDSDVSRLAWEMPAALGFIEVQRLVLRARGLAHLPAADQLLEDWCAVLSRAYRLWCEDRTARLTRVEVMGLLGADPGRTRAVSLLLQWESWPFSGGVGGPDDDWSREMRSAVRAARGARRAADILATRDAIDYPPFVVDTSADGSASRDQKRPPKWRRCLRRAWTRISNSSVGSQVLAAVLAAIVLALGAAVFAAVRNQASQGGSVSRSAAPPPPGSVVNAIDGRVENHVLIRGALPGGPQIAGGPNFRACNLSAGVSCSYPMRAHPIAAHAGDVINFKLRVYNPAAEPLPYAKFYALWGPDSQYLRKLRVEMAIEWPYVHGDGVGRPPGFEEVILALPTAVSSADLVYQPGSTRLLDRTGRVVGDLPDGIMGHGISLTDIGAPPSCFSCDLTYARYITFRAKVI